MRTYLPVIPNIEFCLPGHSGGEEICDTQSQFPIHFNSRSWNAIGVADVTDVYDTIGTFFHTYPMFIDFQPLVFGFCNGFLLLRYVVLTTFFY